MQQYLTEATKEDNEGLSEDMGLVITPKQLAQRAIWWENFADQYPGTIVSPQANIYWQDDVDILLTGLDNSPVIFSGPFTLTDEYRIAYQYLQQNYPGSKTNGLINPYYKLVVKKDSTGAKKLLAKYRAKGIISPEDEGDD